MYLYYKIENNCYIGPERVWLNDENVYGLTKSRDDISCKPEIMEIEFKEEDKFIILSSDGKCEFINNKEVATIVKAIYL